mgnify:CR=1 FL=1
MTDGVDNAWDPERYDDETGFVADYGESVVSLLAPASGESVLDLGCGTGQLTADIAARVGEDGTVVGIDRSAAMVEQAREAHPGVRFERADATAFDAASLLPDGQHFDAVFSNAALHWIDEQAAVTERVADALAPGGRFVAELGGAGNVATIVEAVLLELAERGYDADTPWYFPTVGEHARLLETHGFEVRHATLFDRPTALDGPDGLANWLDVFGDSLFAPLADDEREAVVAAVEGRLRGDLYDVDTEMWTADYRRLRFVAVPA